MQSERERERERKREREKERERERERVRGKRPTNIFPLVHYCKFPTEATMSPIPSQV